VMEVSAVGLQRRFSEELGAQVKVQSVNSV
jgi:hypothetical protein